MNTIEIRQSFHSLIDSIDNDNLLLEFYNIIKTKIRANNGQLWGKLNQYEQQELLEAFRESESPEYLISNEEMKKKHDQWLSK